MLARYISSTSHNEGFPPPSSITNPGLQMRHAVKVEEAITFDQSTFPTAIELSSLNGATGFQMNGGGANDLSGYSVASAGDVNGDGFADILIGAWGAFQNGPSTAGQSYVVFGKSIGFGTVELSSLEGTIGFQLNGGAGDRSGFSVAGAGDVNGDGFADILIGAPFASPNGQTYAGQSYVVFGKPTGFGTIELSSLDGVAGFQLNGEDARDSAGVSVASAGDVNGDGFADILIGAYFASPNGKIRAGQSYVVFGKSAGFETVELSNLNGTIGFQLNGVAAEDFSGQSVASAGDVNQDGFADILIGAYRASPQGKRWAGQSYMVFGKSSGFGTVELSSLDGTAGFQLNGVAAEDHSGCSVASAGDVNQDGFADILIGAHGADPSGRSHAGQSYVVFGKSRGFGTVELSSLDGTAGFQLNGVAAYDYSGLSVASAGDVNKDGFADILIGAFYATPNGKSHAGQSYVVFGKPTVFNTVELSSLDGTTGFQLNGVAASDDSGWSVASAGDVNGDGFADIVIGARYAASPTGQYHAGQSYVVFGNSSTTPTPIPTPMSVPSPSPSPVLTPIPTPVPTPIPVPKPTPIPTSTPVPSPLLSPIAIPTPASSPTPSLNPVSNPMPTPTPMPIPTPLPIPTPPPRETQTSPSLPLGLVVAGAVSVGLLAAGIGFFGYKKNRNNCGVCDSNGDMYVLTPVPNHELVQGPGYGGIN